MNGRSPAPQRRRAGIAALLKSLLLIFGVPAALVELWLAGPRRLGPGGLEIVTTCLVVMVALAWLGATVAFVRELRRALRHEGVQSARWSGRWAAAVAGLLLLAASATTAASNTHRSSSIALPPSVSAPGIGREGPTPRTGTPSVERAAASFATMRARAGISEIEPALALVGIGMLAAAALVRRCHVLRRLRECARRPGERAPGPEPRVARAAALLGPVGGLDLLDWIETANRLLWRSLRDAGPEVARPEIDIVRASPGQVELHLQHPASHAPDGFVASEDGHTWRLDPELDLDALAAITAGCGRYLAGLLPVGDDGDACYLVPVGPGRRLALEGDPERVESLLAYLLVALRTLPWAEELAVELVGAEAPPPEEQCYQISASSFAELAELAEEPRRPEDERLELFWSRAPLAVVARPMCDEEEALVQRLSERIGVVTLGGEASDRLVVDAQGALLEPHGLALDAPQPTAAQLELVNALLAAATTAPTPGPSETPPADGRDCTERLAGLCRPGPIEVRLLDSEPALGGTTTSVAARDRARVVEFLAYLCLHGHTATLDELSSTVFGRPDGSPSPSRTQNICAAARRTLGVSHEGRALLPAARQGRYRLDAAVSCDWTRFSQLCALARSSPPDEAIRALRSALDLLGEHVFLASAATFAWAISEGMPEAVTAEVVDAAHHLASLALAGGDTGLAHWAVERGLRLEPASELLVRDGLVICEANGDRGALRQIYARLEADLERLSGAEPSSETRALYRQLLGEPATSPS